MLNEAKPQIFGRFHIISRLFCPLQVSRSGQLCPHTLGSPQSFTDIKNKHIRSIVAMARKYSGKENSSYFDVTHIWIISNVSKHNFGTLVWVLHEREEKRDILWPFSFFPLFSLSEGFLFSFGCNHLLEFYSYWSQPYSSLIGKFLG